jgi:transcription termination/antitermination protein NusG
MQHRNLQGATMAYRKVFEDELTLEQRARLDIAGSKAEALISAHGNLVHRASNRAAGFADLSRWVVATCRVDSEESISRELAEAHIETWCPMETFRKRPRRGLKPVDYFRPFFRGYLFARVVPCHEAYAGLLCASRLSSLMGRDGRPYLMPERLMNALLLGIKKRQHLEEDEVKVPYHVGDTVRVVDGPFASFQMVVRSVLPSQWKLSGEVQIFGRMTPIEMDIDSVTTED